MFSRTLNVVLLVVLAFLGGCACQEHKREIFRAAGNLWAGAPAPLPTPGCDCGTCVCEGGCRCGPAAPPAPQAARAAVPARSIKRPATPAPQLWSTAEAPRERSPASAAAVALPCVVTVDADKPGRTKPDTGSGVVVDPAGGVLTCAHVVKGAVRVRVRFRDGSTLEAAVVRADLARELALLSVKAPGPLRAARLAGAGPLRPGEAVLAIGSPLGYDWSVSVGAVSATGRSADMPGGVTLTGLVQTDAAINRGNSGGPLVNLGGEVVGLVVAVQEEGVGISFALPLATVVEFLK